MHPMDSIDNDGTLGNLKTPTTTNSEKRRERIVEKKRRRGIMVQWEREGGDIRKEEEDTSD